MTRSLSADLRGRVIAAIEEGLSAREAARRFQVGISTAGSWYRRYRDTGETVARKQGQPSRSKLDPHEVFILGLIEETPDITLAEIAERLAAEHRVRVVPSTVWMFLDKHGVTFKKRRRRSAASLPAALFARLQSDRDGLLQAQGAAEKSRSPGHRRTLVRDRRLSTRVQTKRVPKLLRGCWI